MTSTSSHDVSEALGLWEPKRNMTLEAARRHSVRIRFIRRGLIAISAGLVGLLIWQFLRQDPVVILNDNPNESVRMISPRYTGRTDDGLPYFLTADEAIRMANADDSVDLIKPVLHFFREEGLPESTIVADTGSYDNISKILNLRTTVNLNTDDGNHCVSTHARIFARTKRVEGDEPIRCEGSFGIVNGQAYEILDNYSVFVFKNGMDAILAQGSDGDEAPAEEEEGQP